MAIVHVFFFSSHRSPKHTRRKAGRLTCIVLRESGEEGRKRTEQAGRENEPRTDDADFIKILLEVRRQGRLLSRLPFV